MYYKKNMFCHNCKSLLIWITSRAYAFYITFASNVCVNRPQNIRIQNKCAMFLNVCHAYVIVLEQATL